MNVCPNPKCEKVLPEGAKFCPICGSSVDILKNNSGKDPLIGRVVGERYRLLEMIAEGGMALIYRAEHILLEDPCAVKIIKRDLAVQKEMLKRFQREAKLTRKVAKLSPHIISIYDFGEEEDIGFFYVMELLNGYPFAELLENPDKPPSQLKVVKFIAQIAGALQIVHNEGLIHRDIKPDNIFIHRDPSTGEEMVKLLDFGIARDRNQKGTMLTNFGRVMGTPEYMSPEQCRGPTQEQYKRGETHLDGRSDVYSLGVLLYQCLTGRVPFPLDESNSPIAIHRVMKGHVMEVPIPPIEARPDLDILPALSAITMRALEKKPEDRFQSMLEFRDALLGCLSDLERRNDDKSLSDGRESSKTLPLEEEGESLLSTLDPEDIEQKISAKIESIGVGGKLPEPPQDISKRAEAQSSVGDLGAGDSGGSDLEYSLGETYSESSNLLDKTALDVQLPEIMLREAQRLESSLSEGNGEEDKGAGEVIVKDSVSFSASEMEKTIPSPIPIRDIKKFIEEGKVEIEGEYPKVDSKSSVVLEDSDTEPSSYQVGVEERSSRSGTFRMIVLLTIILIFGTGLILILPRVLFQN